MRVCLSRGTASNRVHKSVDGKVQLGNHSLLVAWNRQFRFPKETERQQLRGAFVCKLLLRSFLAHSFFWSLSSTPGSEFCVCDHEFLNNTCSDRCRITAIHNRGFLGIPADESCPCTFFFDYFPIYPNMELSR